MRRRELRCPSCGDSWDPSTARFCGSCGAALRTTSGRSSGRSGPDDAGRTWASAWRPTRGTSRLTVALAAVAAMVLIGGALVLGIDIDLAGPPTAADDDVALPDELEGPARLTPEQRESLERFEPDRLRCEPRGCDAGRLQLDTEVQLISADHGWLVLLDGPVLRLRQLRDLAPGQDPPPEGSTTEEDPPPEGSTHPPGSADASVRRTTSEVIGGAGVSRQRDPPGYDRDLSRMFSPAAPPDSGTEPGAPPPPDAPRPPHDPQDADPPDGDPPPTTGYLDVAATPPEQLAVREDGSVVLRWLDRLALLDDEGELTWEVPAEDRTFRYAEVVDDLIVVLRDDLPWPEGTTGPRPSPDPILVSVLDADDGAELWTRYTLSPHDATDDSLLVTSLDGSIEMVDLRTGATRWQRGRSASERIQSTVGPWVILARPDRAVLLDTATGAEVATRDRAALLTPLQPIGELWVAAWIDGTVGGGGTANVALVGLDGEGRERWRVPLRSLGGGTCCPAAIPWVDDTIAVFDPAAPAPRWFTITARGGLVELPDPAQPHLPLPYDLSDRIHVPNGSDRLLQRSEDRVALLSVDGQVRVQGSRDLEVVSVDPFVVFQRREVLVSHPVTPPEGTSS